MENPTAGGAFMKVSDGSLRVHLAGPAVSENRISLSDLAQIAKHLQDALYRVAEVLSGVATSLRTGPMPRQIVEACTLELLALEPGSVSLVVGLRRPEQMALLDTPSVGEDALQTLVEGAAELRSPSLPMPKGYDPGVLCAWRDLGAMLDRGVDEIALESSMRGSTMRAVFDREVRERVALRLQAPVHNRRTVEGRLLMGDFKESGYQCRVHPAIGRAVTCAFDEAYRDIVLGALTKQVRVVGEATEKNGRITGLQIADIEVMEEEAGEAAEVELGLDEAPTLDELAARQGVAQVGDFDALLGDFWPEEESADDFIAAVRQWRREDSLARGEQ